MSAPHVVIERNTFVCHHCGAAYRPTLPAPINMFLGMVKVFLQ